MSDNHDPSDVNFIRLIKADRDMYVPPMERIHAIASIAIEANSCDDPTTEYIRILAYALIKRIVKEG